MKPTIQIGTTFGIEMESDVYAGQQDSFLSSNFRRDHDASCESEVRVLTGNNLRLYLNMGPKAASFLYSDRVTVGTEFVSPILDSSEEEKVKDIFGKLTDSLQKIGEPWQSERSGIHFHISLPYPNLRILKSIIRLGRNLEQVFYLAGGMGYEYRGHSNSYAYCRPITNWGPICVKGGAVYQIFDAKDLLSSSTLEQFWERYGDSFNHRGRYHPVRYHWLNLYPLNKNGGDYKGTLEFRSFNKTLNPKFIWAALLLSKYFTNVALESSYKSIKEDGLLAENSIYDSFTKESIIRTAESFLKIAEPEKDEHAYAILDLLNYSVLPRPVKKEFIYTHLRRIDTNYFTTGGYRPTPVRESIKTAKIVDIHTLTGR